MKRYTYFTLLILATLLQSCGENTPVNEKPAHSDEGHIELTSEQFKAAKLQLGTVTNKSFSEEFEVTGIIDVPPANRAAVTSYFDGYVNKTELLIGDEVKKGQVLVVLKHPDFIKLQQNYVEALSNLDYLDSEYQRKLSLFEDKIIAQKVLQATKNQYLNANAEVKAATEQIKLMNLNPKRVADGNFTSEIPILAPISGKVSKLNVAQGKFIAKSEMIMEIVDVDHVHLELDVFEKDLLKIQKGDTLSFTIPEQSNKRFEAYVQLIGAEVNKNRSVRIHAHPLHEDDNFAVGMFVNAYFTTSKKEMMALPETAFTEIDNKTFVLKLDHQKDGMYHFSKVEVSTNNPQNGYKPLLNSKQIESDAKYLTQGVFDLINTGGGGHDH